MATLRAARLHNTQSAQKPAVGPSLLEGIPKLNRAALLGRQVEQGPYFAQRCLWRIGLDLLAGLFPLRRSARLIGVSLSGFAQDEPDGPRQPELAL